VSNTVLVMAAMTAAQMVSGVKVADSPHGGLMLFVLAIGFVIDAIRLYVWLYDRKG
jgi:hypothetical protein